MPGDGNLAIWSQLELLNYVKDKFSQDFADSDCYFGEGKGMGHIEFFNVQHTGLAIPVYDDATRKVIREFIVVNLWDPASRVDQSCIEMLNMIQRKRIRVVKGLNRRIKIP